MAAKLKKGDRVIVLAGKDKGKKGEITRVSPKKKRGVGKATKTPPRQTRQSAQGQGGRIPTAMPVDLSNLALIDSKGKATRVGFRMEDGKKVRFAKSTGETV